MKKIIIILSMFFVIVISLSITYGYFYVKRPVNNVGIVGNEFNFHTPKFIVRLKKGKPDEKFYNDITGTKVYTYNNQNVFGENGTINYWFNAGTLSGVYVIIPGNKEKSETKCNEIYKHMKKVYDDKYSEISDEVNEEVDNHTYSFSGSVTDSNSMSVTVYCEPDEIKIYANAY